MNAHLVACAVCDEPVMINIEVWNAALFPAALCEDCDFIVPWPVLKVIHLLRYKVHILEQQMNEAPA